MDVIHIIIFCKVLWDPWILNHWLFLLMGLSNLVFRSLSKLQTKISSTLEMLLWKGLGINFLFSDNVNKHQDQRGVLEWWQCICCSSWSWIPATFWSEIHRKQLPQLGFCSLCGWCSLWGWDFFFIALQKLGELAGAAAKQGCSCTSSPGHALLRCWSVLLHLPGSLHGWYLDSSYMEMPHSKNIEKKKKRAINGKKMAEGGFVEWVMVVWCSNKHLILRWMPGTPRALELHNNTPQLSNDLFFEAMTLSS